jgi:hypothetical protein
MRKRDYFRKIWADFNKEKNLILVSGPRQASKATFAKELPGRPQAIKFSVNLLIKAPCSPAERDPPKADKSPLRSDKLDAGTALAVQFALLFSNHSSSEKLKIADCICLMLLRDIALRFI